MRIRVALDDDVVAALKRLEAGGQASLEQLVNDLLRAGLPRLVGPRQRYRTPTVSLGRCLIEGLDDVAGVLAAAEDEPKP
jgi:hypothetical protein